MITARYNNGRHPVLLGERKRCGHKGFAAFAVTVNITTNNISFRDRPTGPASISRLPCANTTGLPILPPCLDLSTEWMFANRRHQMVAKQALFIWYMNRYHGYYCRQTRRDSFRERFTFLPFPRVNPARLITRTRLNVAPQLK